MKNLICAVVTVGVSVGAASVVEAQSPIPFSVEVRADAAFPMGGDFAEHAETGVGWGVNAAVQIVPNIGLYGSYSRFTFDLDIADASVVDHGFAVGLTTSLPALVPGLVPWIGAGLLLHNLDREGVPNAPTGDTGLGFEVGGGIAVPLAPRIRFTPGVGYRRYTAPFLHDTETISYLTAGVGLNVAF